MGELKKFMFDNFIIECDETKHCRRVVEDKSAITEDIEVIEFEPVEEVFEEVIEPEPEVAKTYTQEELDEKVQIANQTGYEKGFKSSQEGIDAIAAAALTEINSKLLHIITDAETGKVELERQSLDLVANIVKKLIPSLIADEAKNIVNKFIADNFNNFKNEAKLSFYIHPDIISYVQENISKLANSYDFEGKIALHKDAKLGISDCRIEWDSGGVERNAEQMLGKVDAMLENKQN